jgi:hypothetical protein
MEHPMTDDGQLALSCYLIDLPHATVRTLHSEYVGYVLRLPEPLRSSFLERSEGLDYEHFLLAAGHRRFLGSVREVGGSLHVGLALPVTDGPDVVLFEVQANRAGLDHDWLTASVTLDVEMELERLAEGEQ